MDASRPAACTSNGLSCIKALPCFLPEAEGKECNESEQHVQGTCLHWREGGRGHPGHRGIWVCRGGVGGHVGAVAAAGAAALGAARVLLLVEVLVVLHSRSPHVRLPVRCAACLCADERDDASLNAQALQASAVFVGVDAKGTQACRSCEADGVALCCIV